MGHIKMDMEMDNKSDNQEKWEINGYLLDKYKNYFKLSQIELHKDPFSEGVRYKFGQCDDKTKSKESLQVHKQSKHDVRYGCDQCDYKATQKGSLNRHRQSKHEGLRYDCDQCN